MGVRTGFVFVPGVACDGAQQSTKAVLFSHLKCVWVMRCSDWFVGVPLGLRIRGLWSVYANLATGFKQFSLGGNQDFPETGCGMDKFAVTN